MPFLNLLASFFIRKLMRYKDGSDPNQTVQCSIPDYKKVWGGNEFRLHSKFANLLNITFVTMLFGLGLPLLFPIAALNLLTKLFCEKLQLVYFSTRTKSFDDKLPNLVNRILLISPIIFAFNGYWMISNPEIFKN